MVQNNRRGDEVTDKLTNLRRLREVADGIVDTVQPSDFDEAINWGDLGVHATALVLYDDGQLEYQVHVEELDPNCPKFTKHVEAELLRKGWSATVVCSW